jgi:hypothetical protein
MNPESVSSGQTSAEAVRESAAMGDRLAISRLSLSACIAAMETMRGDLAEILSDARAALLDSTPPGGDGL